MATTLVSVEEYLRTSYEPDAEYVDGVIEERPVGENRHSAWQIALAVYFGSRAKDWGIRVRSELRTKTSERRYRIPDIAILDADAPPDPVAIVPPLAAFEILSPEDRMPRLLIRLADFEKMGVAFLYVIDPADNSFRRHQAGTLVPAEQVTVHGHVVPTREIIDTLW